MEMKKTDAVRLGTEGFSIVEVLVALTIMSIVTLGLVTMITTQTTEIKGIDEKMALQGVQAQIGNVFSSAPYCGCFIGANTFNYTTTTWNGFPTTIASSYGAGCAPSGGALLTLGSNIGNSTLRPISMAMMNVIETVAGAGTFSGDLVIGFEQSLLTRTRKPISIPMYFQVNMGAPVAARTLVACGSSASGGSAGWSLTGNSGTNGTNFIGTNDDVDLVIKRNGQLAGLFRADSVAIGRGAGVFPGFGARNSVLGSLAFSAGSAVTNDNTAVGSEALAALSTGDFNTAIGVQAIGNATNTSGATAVGYRALRIVTTGTSLTAVGARALEANTTGSVCTAVGDNALQANTTGLSNTAVGANALLKCTTGSYNTSVGLSSLWDLTTGGSNSAVGLGAGRLTTTGWRNVYFGEEAGMNHRTGNDNTFIGARANATADNFTNSTALGAFAIVNDNNKVRIGGPAVTVIEGQVAWSVSSDARLKRDIMPYSHGLDFVRELRPVSYIFKSDATGKRQMGFIAQDIANTTFPFYGLHKPKSKNGYYSLSYSDFVMPLVNSVQELDRENGALRKELAALQKVNALLVHRLDLIERTIRESE